jgi:hypothetical protein
MPVTIGETIRLYDGPAPGSEGRGHEERRYHSEIFDTAVVVNVVVPTLTPVRPEQGGGPAVIVAPGGGYRDAADVEDEQGEGAGRGDDLVDGDGLVGTVGEARRHRRTSPGPYCTVGMPPSPVSRRRSLP